MRRLSRLIGRFTGRARWHDAGPAPLGGPSPLPGPWRDDLRDLATELDDLPPLPPRAPGVPMAAGAPVWLPPPGHLPTPAHLAGGRHRPSRPERLRQPAWFLPSRRAALRGGAAAAVLAAGIWLVADGYLGRTTDALAEGLVAVSAEMGFTLGELLVTGRIETSAEAVLAATGAASGMPLLGFDAQAARQRLEALPWVKRAEVERRFPSTVAVTLEERTPAALWQREGRFALIDGDGHVITEEGLERFATLLQVVGEGANLQLRSLAALLGSQPHLAERVKIAQWVGGRRWTLRIGADLDVLLPDENPAAALERLVALDRAERLLSREVSVIDLRIPDRLVLKLREDGRDGSGSGGGTVMLPAAAGANASTTGGAPSGAGRVPR